ncbi:Mitogen-activated protein kinase kinase kinase [Parasponia andersonii]|uniref:Mitogen-activated protein kinase kinase kinase n=1 Tax=Parasponia andersonii TaxID=3476 RepID=A0A2P5ASF9_PARAD|nr:Mitogen-activated protein kinase kinase kinase [Parasponia andersonii]
MKSTCNKYTSHRNITMILIRFYLSLIIFHVFTVEITDGQPLPYRPAENIALACGSAENDTSPDRTWDGDVNSKFFHLLEGQNNASIALSALEPSQYVPYKTARLSKSEIRYTIPVIPGQKFIRLHFYASGYGILDRSNAFFTVKAGQYTLLRNFSTALTADVFNSNEIVKEFCVTVEDSTLNITLAPDVSSNPEAFAFVNGLELVSMPVDLYYENYRRVGGIRFIGQDSTYSFGNDTALETMYRVNIGGAEVTPAKDTGFFRNWEGIGREILYLTEQGLSVPPILNGSINLSFKAISDYVAPEAVYRTARSMGTDKERNKKYNLTWEFQVDSGFQYLIRLHFCEIESVVNEIGGRSFFIFISNQSAEERADVFMWSGGQYVPYYREYVVSMIKPGAKKPNISIALQANPDDMKTSHTDAILNGVEIFKLSDTNRNLAGPNPDTSPCAPPPSQQPRNPENSRAAVFGISSGVVCGVILLCIIGFLILRRWRKVKDSAAGDGTTRWRPISFTTNKSSKTRGSSSLPSDLCRYFSLAEIRAATNNFEDIFIIGVGGFGNVYKGYIDNGTNPVAIKRLKPESSQGANEFKTEIEMLSHLRHRHLVSLIGYCNDDREMILVYDYMARGTLCHHLYNTDNSPLSWKQRLEICLGAARGLQYLHTGAKHTIIHRDVKTTNILLDEKWVAKVSDFGLSKTGPTGISKAHVTTVVKGSVGYLDPEYYKRQQLTEKSDVYSFGVVLCEVLCARPPILRTAGKGKVSLAEWAPSCYRDGTLDQIIDPHLTGKIAPECLKKYGEIFVSCMLDNGTERPSMNDIVWGLEFAMQLQQSAEDNDRAGGEIITAKDKDAIPFMNDNSDGTFTSSWEDTSVSKSSGMTKFSSSDKGSTTNESIKGMSGAVFSEINNNAKGR